MLTNFFGLQQLVPFTGVVEDRLDKTKANMVAVRIHGLDSAKKTDMPTEELIWAQVLLPTTSSGMNGIGDSVHGLVEGSLVFGFFLDQDLQMPMVVGSFSGIPLTKPEGPDGFIDPREDRSKAPKRVASRSAAKDGSGTKIESKAQGERYPFLLDEPDSNRLARGENVDQTIAQFRIDNVDTGVPTASGSTWNEPKTQYNPVYPYNKVRESESGHIIEFDDTPGAERVLVQHRSGSFVEIHPDGSVVTKTVNNDYKIVLKDENIHIEGKSNQTVDKGLNLFVNKDAQSGADLKIKVGSGSNLDLKVDGGDLKFDVTGNVIGKASGDATVEIGGNTEVRTGGNTEVRTGGNLNLTAGGSVTIADGGDLKFDVTGNVIGKASGDATVEIGGNTEVRTGGNLNLTAGGDLKFDVTGNVIGKASGDATVEIGGNTEVRTGGNLNLTAGGSVTIAAGGSMTLSGSVLDMNF